MLLWQPWFWRRLAVTGACLVLWRALAQIVMPGVSTGLISLRLQGLTLGTGLLHAIGANGLPVYSYSLVVMGITPYIYAVIVMSLVKACFGPVRTLAESPGGSMTLRRWTRVIAAALAMGQAYGVTQFMQLGSALGELGWFSRLLIVLALTGGTMMLILLADAIDEFGLGYGHGAVLIYALTPVGLQVHRMADILAGSPSPDRLYLPLAIWAAFTGALVAATVAILAAVRRVQPPAGKSRHATELGLLMSGVIRPPIYAGAIMSLPAILSGYLGASNPGLGNAINAYWAPDGPNGWISAAHTALDASLVLGFTYFVVFTDFPAKQLGPSLTRRVARLTLIGGGFLALSVSVIPIVEEFVTTTAGLEIPMSGYDVTVVAAVVLSIFMSTQPSRAGARGPSLQPQLL